MIKISLIFHVSIILHLGLLQGEKRDIKSWTVRVYATPLTDYLTWHSLRAMALAQKSNSFYSVVVQAHFTDVQDNGWKDGCIGLIDYKKIKLLQLPSQDVVDSSKSQRLIDFCAYCSEHYPAQNTALIIWGAGNGYFPHRPNRFFPAKSSVCGGIAYDKKFKSYMPFQEFTEALAAITQKEGKKIEVVGFDASRMGSFEIAVLSSPYVKYMIASEDAVLGLGWDYQSIFKVLNKENIKAEEWAQHCVHANGRFYETRDLGYSFAAYDLMEVIQLNSIIDQIALDLLLCLKHQIDNSMWKWLETCFISEARFLEEHSGIDLQVFLTSLMNNCACLHLSNEHEGVQGRLINLLEQALAQLKHIVVALETGKYMKSACGLSLYFPLKQGDDPYYHSQFSQINHWPEFVEQFNNLYGNMKYFPDHNHLSESTNFVSKTATYSWLLWSNLKKVTKNLINFFKK